MNCTELHRNAKDPRKHRWILQNMLYNWLIHQADQPPSPWWASMLASDVFFEEGLLGMLKALLDEIKSSPGEPLTESILKKTDGFLGCLLPAIRLYKERERPLVEEEVHQCYLSIAKSILGQYEKSFPEESEVEEAYLELAEKVEGFLRS